MPVSPALKLEQRPAGRIRPQLDGLRRVLTDRGSPQFDFPSILIVGTNGKGSTAAVLEAVLRAHDLRTGLFTSPHLVRVEERIQLNGLPVDSTVLAEHIGSLDDAPDLTYFETLTAAALKIFSEARVDVAVLEAGMGGSWDATRVAKSEIAGLTNIGSDHAGWLGDRPSAIARDKGRALAAASRAILGSGVDDDLVPHIAASAARRADTLVGCSDVGDGRMRLRWGGQEIDANLPLVGAFQRDNIELAMALALEAVDAGLVRPLDPDPTRYAIENVRWPGRLSVHQIAGRSVLMDCAHNLEAAAALASYLDDRERRYNLLFSCLDDKPVEAMAAVLRPHVGDVVVCPLDDERAMATQRLATAFPDARVAENPQSGLDQLRDPVLAAGSIRLVGALLALAEAAP